MQNGESDFYRVLVGRQGHRRRVGRTTPGSWYSKTKGHDVRTGYLQRDVTFALLNPSAANVAAATGRQRRLRRACRREPCGASPRNAGLNSAALVRRRCRRAITSDSRAKITQIDVKASREIGKLEAARSALPSAPRLRRESVSLTPVTGTERGNVIGRSATRRYDGGRTVSAAYAEVLAPLHEAARGARPRCATTTTRRRQLDDAQVRHQVHADPRARRCAAPARRAFARRARPRTASAAWRAFSTATDPAALRARHRGRLRARQRSP